MTTRSNDREGEVVGAWRIVRTIGRGGTATVYAVEGRGGQRAALKVLDHAVAEEPGFRQRFVREAYVANQVDHPGVVRVLDTGNTPDGAPYLVMELLEGETIETRRVRKGGKLPPLEVVWMADEALAVLASAHKKGIVHRDIKPENLFLTRSGQLRVLDFGIARLFGADALTRAGTILGTLAFMAPEQARGDLDAIGVASDVWAVGATMFTCLCGRHVRPAEGIASLLEAGRRSILPLHDIAPEVPLPVVGVVDAALSFDPSVRWPTAATMRRALHLAYAEMKRKERRPDDETAATDEVFDVGHVRGGIAPPPFSMRNMPTVRPPPIRITERPESPDHGGILRRWSHVVRIRVIVALAVLVLAILVGLVVLAARFLPRI